jgi:hypothetical protein
MDKKTSKYLQLLNGNEEALLNFLKAKFPVFHNSNFFFRDLQYGIKSFLEKKDVSVTYQQADELAKEIAKQFEEKNIFIKINERSWTVKYPEFATTEPGDPL